MTKMKIFASSDVGVARQSSKDKAQSPPTHTITITITIQYNPTQLQSQFSLTQRCKFCRIREARQNMTHADKSIQSKYLALAAKLDWPTRIQGSSKQYDGELFGNLIRSGQHGKFTESKKQKEKLQDGDIGESSLIKHKNRHVI